MGFEDFFSLSVHAVITDESDRVLLLAATYADRAWGLPGGALEPGETVHQALRRECLEELGTEISIAYLSGIYAHTAVRSHALIFRCHLPPGAEIRLSKEHSEYRFAPLESLPAVQRQRVEECLRFTGEVRSALF